MRDERPQAPAGSVVGKMTDREPDFDAMTADELDAWIIANSPKLSSFPLHTHEWRLAFLRELYMQGYPALFEGVSRAWALMERPKTARCTYVGLLAGTGGKGKKALYNFFHRMIADALAVSSHIPKIDDYPSLDAWNDAVHQQWKNEERAVEHVIQNYALLLVGRVPEPAPPLGVLIRGPWDCPAGPQGNAVQPRR